MWISRKRLKATEKRIADLEREVQDQPSYKNAKTDYIQNIYEGGLFNITATDKVYINEVEGLTVVSFRLPISCWNQLQTSFEWGQLQSKLQEIQRKYIQMYHPEQG